MTGLKVWHLRDGSEFFPKANFESAVASIPDGADTIFAFGEIDCREGLLLAVERARCAMQMTQLMGGRASRQCCID